MSEKSSKITANQKMALKWKKISENPKNTGEQFNKTFGENKQTITENQQKLLGKLKKITVKNNYKK